MDGDGKDDMICDDLKGNHWAILVNGHGYGHVNLGWHDHFHMNGFCDVKGGKVTWADVNGDGVADILCDDNHGGHWGRTMNKHGHVLRYLG